MLLYLPTGAGKTVIATFIIKALSEVCGVRRVLFVAHRREILDQTARTLKQHLPSRRVAVEQGERSVTGKPDIIVASVQSLVHRKERYDPAAFDLIICDECHRALAPSWEEVIDYFWRRVGGERLLLGMTATPRRSDGKSASNVFGEPAFEISRTDLVDLGYLVPLQYFTVKSRLDLDKIKLSAGDFQVGALAKRMDTPAQRALAVKAWLEQGASQRTIAFCAGVEHARHLAEDFAALGVRSETIDGRMKARDEVLQRFRDGEVQVLTNYGVLTEGFDDPGVACILMARPTTSPLVYTQCIGRGLRTATGKHACVVIDIVDRSTHQLQYGANEMAGLPSKWRCRGADPFRQARSLSGVKVTCPDAFLRIRNAVSLDEVQEILMSLPPEVVVAGLDGERVLRYEPSRERPNEEQAQSEVRRLLRQARALGAKAQIAEDVVEIRFRSPETENERFAYLKWHLTRVTARRVEFMEPARRSRPSNPRTVLRSMLPERCRITNFAAAATGDGVTANIAGLTAAEVSDVAQEFFQECGMPLEVKGQMSLF